MGPVWEKLFFSLCLVSPLFAGRYSWKTPGVGGRFSQCSIRRNQTVYFLEEKQGWKKGFSFSPAPALKRNIPRPVKAAAKLSFKGHGDELVFFTLTKIEQRRAAKPRGLCRKKARERRRKRKMSLLLWEEKGLFTRAKFIYVSRAYNSSNAAAAAHFSFF